MASVAVIDRHLVELGAEIVIHRIHQVAGGLRLVGQLDAFPRGDDEAELVAVAAASVEESAAVLSVTLGGKNLPFLGVAFDAIPLQIAQVGVNRLGACELAAPRRATLHIELTDPGLHRHAPGAGRHAVRVPASGVSPPLGRWPLQRAGRAH